MIRSRGRIRVEGLAAEIGWSRKRLWSRFRSQIGIAPTSPRNWSASTTRPIDWPRAWALPAPRRVRLLRPVPPPPSRPGVQRSHARRPGRRTLPGGGRRRMARAEPTRHEGVAVEAEVMARGRLQSADGPVRCRVRTHAAEGRGPGRVTILESGLCGWSRRSSGPVIPHGAGRPLAGPVPRAGGLVFGLRAGLV
jgi:hypothetical protein